ncbi:MAG: peptidyl-prolyl cis-trans isomerase [Thermoleophilia bacterium]
MRKYTGIICGLIIAMVMLLLFSACSDVPSNAAATVNGSVITKDAVAQRIRIGAGINPSKTPTDIESQEYKDFQRDMTEQMVAEEVERQEAERRGITVSSTEVNAIIDQVIDDKYLGSIEKMQEDFAKRGLNEDDIRQEILRRLLHQKILESLRAEVAVTEEQARAQYEADKNNYVSPEKRQVRQVVSADEATAQNIANRVSGGEDMAVIAGQSSIDSKTKTNGGLVGMVTRTQLPKAVGDMAYSMAVNEVSAPFKGDLGWYVIRVELIVAAANSGFEDVKAELMTHLSNQNLSERYKTYVQEIKDDYEIEYADDYSPREVTPADETTPEPTDTAPALS